MLWKNSISKLVGRPRQPVKLLRTDSRPISPAEDYKDEEKNEAQVSAQGFFFRKSFAQVLPAPLTLVCGKRKCLIRLRVGPNPQVLTP
jgi:hypothetical protein